MKKFLALAVLATATSSFAAPERHITDIMYLPNAGTSFGISELSSIGRVIKGDESDNDADISGAGFTQSLGHSFTDRFALAATLGYGSVEVDPDTGSKYDVNGISDPVITAKFRALDEAYTLDFIGTALVSIGDAKQDDDGDQNYLQGGHAFEVGVQFGKKASQNFSWALTAAVRNNFERTIDADSQGDIDGKSNNEYKLRADILNKLAEKSFLRSHIDIVFQDALESDEDSTNLYSSYTIYTIGSEYQHLLKENVLLRGGLDLVQYNHDSGYVDSDIEARINLGATYQF